MRWLYRHLTYLDIYYRLGPGVRQWIQYLSEWPHREKCQKELAVGVWCGRGHNHPGPHKPEGK